MLFHLSHLSALTLQGSEAGTFLQGQLTTDIHQVTETHYQPAALCNLQGRIISLMDVCQWQSVFYLILPHSLLEKVNRVLAKPAQFSHTQLTQKEELCVMGYWHQDTQKPPFQCPETPFSCVSTEEYFTYCVKEHFYILLLTKTYAETLCSTIPVEKNNHLWHQARIKQGSIEIYPATCEQFLPHRLNLHETPCISFNKGCYRGQEIIARTHYRATLKHRLAQYLVASEEIIEPGMAVYDAQNLPIGELIDVSRVDEKQYIIAASLLLDHTMTVRFGSNQNNVNLSHLP